MEHVARLRHAGGGLQVVADDIADGQRDGALVQGEGVTPLAAALRGVGAAR
ncbi:hypothetical protein [Streptomyces griseofuscus]|uniref:hypothetical protein n=1 Tax=Streptomyces griseofuscus TaxID=146922 RepID=UPI00381E31AE